MVYLRARADREAYDRLGYAGQDIQYTAIEAFPTAHAARKEIERQKAKGRNLPSSAFSRR